MKVLHVISDINPTSGGPSRSSQGLVAGLNRIGVSAWLVALHQGAKPWVDGVTHFEAIDGAALFPSLLAKIAPDIVHIHGIWSLEMHGIVQACCRRHIPYVIAPRGMLEPWSLAQKWLKKRIARFLYQDADIRHAAALHATAESEAVQFRRLGFTNPVIISPNGVNVPETMPNNACENNIIRSVTHNARRRRALYVSRMHPKKGVLELVESWSRVNSQDWQCELVYTLNGDVEREYEKQVKQRILALGLSYVDADGTIHSSTKTSDFNFILTGTLNDSAKWQAYARADLFILPTYSENFGIVVAEALWAGLPVITTKGTPWQDLETYDCGKWIDLPPVRSLDLALSQIFNLSPSQLHEFGANGHKLVEEKFTWTAACKAMLEGYKKIIER